MTTLESRLSEIELVARLLEPGRWVDVDNDAINFSDGKTARLLMSPDTALKLAKSLRLAMEELRHHVLNHDHTDFDENFRRLGESYGYCTLCRTKVEIGSDDVRDVLSSIEDLWKETQE
jgi:hypothetical protein